MKPDSDCQPITLIMRKYYPKMREYSKKYYEAHKEEIKRKLREKYANDPEYRAKKLEQKKINQEKHRQLKQNRH